MKIIDLLNKIANGEKVPKKIKYKGSIYTYLEQEENKIYQYEDYNAVLDIQCFEKLNDEVEIIEEDKKIKQLETKKVLYDATDEPDRDDEFYLEDGNEDLFIGEKCQDETKVALRIIDKINEIIDYLQSKGE